MKKRDKNKSKTSFLTKVYKFKTSNGKKIYRQRKGSRDQLQIIYATRQPSE